MANTTETATFNVKSNIGEVGKDAQTAAGEFRVMGVSLNGVKAAFASAGATAKAMFATVKAGLISTGIGALVVAVGSLISYFTKTKAGAELLSRAFAGIGAAVDVLTDRISAIGGAIVKVFSGDFKGAVEDVKTAMVGIGDEISKEAQQAIELERTMQGIADSEREQNIARAEANEIIAKARLDAENESLSLEERMAALKVANEAELAVTAENLRLQNLKVEAVRKQVGLGESMAEDLDRLNQEEVKLIEMRTKSFSTQKRLATGLETLRVEHQAKSNSRAKARKSAREKEAKEKEDQEKKEAAATQKLAEQTAKILQDIRFKGIKDAEELAQAKLEAQYKAQQEDIQSSIATQEQKQAAEEALLTQFEENKEAIVQQFKDVAKAKTDEEAIALLELQQENQLAEMEDLRARGLEELRIQEEKEMAGLEGKENADALGFEIDKKYARLRNVVNKEADKTDEDSAKALRDMKIGFALQMLNAVEQFAGEGTALAKAAAIAQAGITGTMATLEAFKSGNANAPMMALTGGAFGFIQAGLAAGFAAKQIANIASSSPPDTSITPPDTTSDIDTTTGPAPEMMSGAFDLGGGIAPEPMKAFVVTDEMTNSQDQLANIRRTATI
jgi:hypothetical protein